MSPALPSAVPPGEKIPPAEASTVSPKPPRMRWETYNRLLAQYDDLDNRWAVGVMARFGIKLSRATGR